MLPAAGHGEPQCERQSPWPDQPDRPEGTGELREVRFRMSLEQRPVSRDRRAEGEVDPEVPGGGWSATNPESRPLRQVGERRLQLESCTSRVGAGYALLEFSVIESTFAVVPLQGGDGPLALNI